MALGQVFLRVLRFSPRQCHRINTPYSFPSTCCCYTEGHTGEAWESSKKQCFVGNAGAWGRQVPALFFCGLQSVIRCFEWYAFKILVTSMFAVL